MYRLQAFIFTGILAACNIQVAEKQPPVAENTVVAAAKPEPPAAAPQQHIVCDTIPLSHKDCGVRSTWDDEYLKTTQYKVMKQRLQMIDAWNKKYSCLHLPDGASIIDEKAFSTPHGQRVILAYMECLTADLVMGEADQEAEAAWYYIVNGSGSFSGALSFALVDPAAHLLKNAVHLRDFEPESKENGDTVWYRESAISYPFAMLNPAKRHKTGERFVYRVTGGSAHQDGTADVMHFTDFNNDGHASEFMIYSRHSSVELGGTLLGYDAAHDSLINYAWNITWHRHYAGKDTTWQSKEYWMNYEMATALGKNDSLHFVYDLTGRGGDFYDYSLYYDKRRKCYAGVIIEKEDRP